MKFSVNDFVKYSNKRNGLDVTGVIIGVYKYPGGGQYLIEPEPEMKLRHWSYYPHDMLVQYNPQYDLEKFRPPTEWGTIRSKKSCLDVSINSKNLKHAFLPYDPRQQPQEEDDV